MLASVWGRNCHRLCGRKEAVFRAFFGCSGVVGFNGRCLGASSGAGGFMLACISGCRGVIGFKVGTWPCPVREKVRPAWPGVGVSAKKFALLGLVWVRARKSSPGARKMAQNRRFVACWASFFAEMPLEGVCWANFFAEMPLEGVCWAKCFANQQSCDPVGRTLSRRSPGSRPPTGGVNPSMRS